MSDTNRPDSVMLRVGRRRPRLTRLEIAAALGIGERTLAYYESGRPVPKPVMLAARALFGRSAEMDMGRERWVKAVDHLLRYGRGEPVAGQLMRERGLQDLSDMLDLARRRPAHSTAMTDPARFKALRDAGTKAYLEGLLTI